MREPSWNTPQVRRSFKDETDYNGMNTYEEEVSVLHVYLGAKGLRDIIER